MFVLALSLSFRSLVTETGAGMLCHATLPLRVDPAEREPRVFSGIGFGVDGLSARFAAEGEALERATWATGALWNSVHFTEDARVLPEEAALLLPAKWRRRLLERPATVISALENGGDKVWIPAAAAFFYPMLSHDWKRHSVTTGWAYHTDRETAAASAYYEVVERDLAMLYWQGLLGAYLQPLAAGTIRDWGRLCGLVGDCSPLQVIQTVVRLPSRFGGQAYYTLVLHASDEMPYLSVGQALKPSARQSFASAVGEYLMLRSHQHEQVLCGITEAPDTDFAAHVIRTNQAPNIRDKAVALTQSNIRLEALTESRLDYSHQRFWLAYFDPPPVTRQGVVAKVWIDGCQPMLPAGVPCGLVGRWRHDWNIGLNEWEQN
ncbi:MAG: YcaO-like family protein [Methylococcales bacterium]|nr:YcaO-like family protein [Methylococcales bacterium]